MAIDTVEGLPQSAGAAQSAGLLARVAVAAGLGWSIAFVAIGVRWGLQLYGDGAIFSYAVVTQSAWAVHWHNIANRSFVYLVSLAPAEAYVRVTQDADGGIVLYGLLFFGAPLVGLAATFFADRSAGRVIFTVACASTACLCPLVFGFPTEMWIAHAVFWPALALAHGAPRTPGGFALVLAGLLALVFAHEAALVLAFAIVLTLLLRGRRDPRFVRGAICFALVLAAWIAMKVVVPPDSYFAPVLADARLNFFNPLRLADRVLLLIVAALAGYGVLSVALRRMGWRGGDLAAAVVVVAGLAAYWWLLAPPLHAEHRYFLRTLLVLALPCVGALAALLICLTGDAGAPPPDWARPAARALARLATREGTLAIAMLIVVVVHAVETARFVNGWTDYVAAVRVLANGPASDSQLGDSRFVSSARIPAPLQELAWSSTTPFLSVLVSPGFRPAHLVVDPAAGYFWLPCALASANSVGAVPASTRGMIQSYACQHRR